MSLSVLDAFVLSLLDRGLETPYDLQRQGGLSLGASTPALRRLVEANLVERTDRKSATKRPRHEYRLTASGKREAGNAWKPFLKGDPPSDIDELLRVVDMASHYGAEKPKIHTFLKRAAEKRSQLAEQANLSTKPLRRGVRVSYTDLRFHCDFSRLMAEAEALRQIASVFRAKGSVQGQTSLLDFSAQPSPKGL